MKAAGITVSFSPGISVTPLNGSFIASHGYAVSYRVSEDMWDLWDSNPDGTFPSGIRQKLKLSGAAHACAPVKRRNLTPRVLSFGRAETYASLIGFNESYPDWDMLPIGTMMHASVERGVYGPASPTRLTRDEQLTTLTLWSITRAPLMIGGRLPVDDDDTWTLPLLSACAAVLMRLRPLMPVPTHASVIIRSQSGSTVRAQQQRRCAACAAFRRAQQRPTCVDRDARGVSGERDGRRVCHRGTVQRGRGCCARGCRACAAGPGSARWSRRRCPAVRPRPVGARAARSCSTVARFLLCRGACVCSSPDALAFALTFRLRGLACALPGVTCYQLPPHGAGMFVLWLSHVGQACSSGAEMFAFRA